MPTLSVLPAAAIGMAAGAALFVGATESVNAGTALAGAGAVGALGIDGRVAAVAELRTEVSGGS